MKIVFFEVNDASKFFPMFESNGINMDSLIFFSKKINELSYEELESVCDAEIISVFIYSHVDKEIINKFTNLKLIQTRSTGYDHIDILEAKSKGILVSNVPKYGDSTVAEHTFALLLTLSRRITESVLITREGKFISDGLCGFDLRGKSIGIVGTGSIGEKVIKIANGFEMDIYAFSHHIREDLVKEYDVKFLSFEELLKTVDILSFHVPDTLETHHMLNVNNIYTTKKGVIILNTARGGILETNCLFEGLKHDHIGGLGLDVLEEEGDINDELEVLKQKESSDLLTLLEDRILLSKNNVVITPHNAFNSIEALQRIKDVTVESIVEFIGGTPTNTIHY